MWYSDIRFCGKSHFVPSAEADLPEPPYPLEGKLSIGIDDSGDGLIQVLLGNVSLVNERDLSTVQGARYQRQHGVGTRAMDPNVYWPGQYGQRGPRQLGCFGRARR